MKLFEIQHAHFSYGATAKGGVKGGGGVLCDLSFSIDPGEILAILGKNGMGKTTLIKCCIGALSWRAGDSFLNGVNIKKIPHKQLFKKIAYVPQAKNFQVNLSVLDMVLLGCNMDITSTPGPEHFAKAELILEKLNITRLREKSCAKLSGGELQMVILARSLINDPALVILDEPESNLDFKNQNAVVEILTELKREKKAIMLNTHFPQNAHALADKVLILHENGHTLGGPELVNKTKLSEIFDVPGGFFDYLNLPSNAPAA